MAANDVPLFFFLDPGFLGFVVICALVYGAWKLVEKFRG